MFDLYRDSWLQGQVGGTMVESFAEDALYLAAGAAQDVAASHVRNFERYTTDPLTGDRTLPDPANYAGNVSREMLDAAIARASRFPGDQPSAADVAFELLAMQTGMADLADGIVGYDAATGNEIKGAERCGAVLRGAGGGALAALAPAAGLGKSASGLRQSTKSERPGAQSTGRVHSANSTSRALADRLADYQQNPGRWRPESIHAEPGMSRRDRGGSSEQIIYRNTDTGETLVRHRVTNCQGKVIDDHFRPDYKPRVDE